MRLRTLKTYLKHLKSISNCLGFSHKKNIFKQNSYFHYFDFFEGPNFFYISGGDNHLAKYIRLCSNFDSFERWLLEFLSNVFLLYCVKSSELSKYYSNPSWKEIILKDSKRTVNPATSLFLILSFVNLFPNYFLSVNNSQVFKRLFKAS